MEGMGIKEIDIRPFGEGAFHMAEEREEARYAMD